MALSRKQFASLFFGFAACLAGLPVGLWLAGMAVVYETPCRRAHEGCTTWQVYRIVGPALVALGLAALAVLLVAALVAMVRGALDELRTWYGQRKR